MTNDGSKDLRLLRRMQGLIAFLVLVWMLRAASEILMPLGVAAVITALVWPLQAWLEKRLPRSLGVVATMSVMLSVVAAIGSLLWMCSRELAAKAHEYRQLFQSFIDHINETLEKHHLFNLQNHLDPARLVNHAISLVESFAVGTYQFSGVVVAVLVFVVLLLIEITPFSRRLNEQLDKRNAAKWLGAARNSATGIHRFMLTRTFTSFIVGLATGILTWAIGLDFPLVWAVMSFFLNYIPVLGAIVAVIPPSLIALLNPGAWWVVFVTPLGLTLIHFVVGNYVDPLLQGRYLSLPPILVFYAIVFWGWVWGIWGAIIGVPMTVAMVISFKHFESTRRLAMLLLSRSKRE